MFFVSYIILVICYMLLIHIISTTVDQILYYYCIFILYIHSQKESSSEEECRSTPSRPKASTKSRAPSWVPSLLVKSSGNSCIAPMSSGG